MNGEIPTPPAQDPNDKPSTPELSPEQKDFLRKMQVLLIKNGADVIRSDEGHEELKRRLEEGTDASYIYDVLLNYRPDITDDLVEGKAITKVVRDPEDSNAVDMHLHLTMPLNSALNKDSNRLDYDKRLLLHVWLDFGDFGVIVEFLTKQTPTSRQIPMATARLEDPRGTHVPDERAKLIQDYEKAKHTDEELWDSFGVSQAFEAKFRYLKNLGDQKGDPSRDIMNPADIDFVRLGQKITELTSEQEGY